MSKGIRCSNLSFYMLDWLIFRMRHRCLSMQTNTKAIIMSYDCQSKIINVLWWWLSISSPLPLSQSQNRVFLCKSHLKCLYKLSSVPSLYHYCECWMNIPHLMYTLRLLWQCRSGSSLYWMQLSLKLSFILQKRLRKEPIQFSLNSTLHYKSGLEKYPHDRHLLQ